ncbi:MAG: hypothetical protein CM15mP115_22910 [Alphaproteobacteria bacterium]|nr:MAG: hypothetical protein CM15mP115_22910 [Alphaproteobacteria bacterium]
MNLSLPNPGVHAGGLGKEDGVLTLRVPPDNFGGAYVEDGNPQFDGETAPGTAINSVAVPDHLASMW